MHLSARGPIQAKTPATHHTESIAMYRIGLQGYQSIEKDIKVLWRRTSLAFIGQFTRESLF